MENFYIFFLALIYWISIYIWIKLHKNIMIWKEIKNNIKLSELTQCLTNLENSFHKKLNEYSNEAISLNNNISKLEQDKIHLKESVNLLSTQNKRAENKLLEKNKIINNYKQKLFQRNKRIQKLLEKNII